MESLTRLDELECGADVINLLVDVSDEDKETHGRLRKQMARLRRTTRVPIILELSRQVVSDASYLDTLKMGACCQPDFLALDLGIASMHRETFIPVSRNIKMIATFHQPRSLSDD